MNRMSIAHAGALTAFALATSASAHDAPGAHFTELPEWQQAARLLGSAHRSQMTARPAADPADLPKLTAFSVEPKINAALGFAQLRVELSVESKASGLVSATVYATSVDGTQELYSYIETGFPTRKIDLGVGLQFDSLKKPGKWIIQQVELYDEAGDDVQIFDKELSRLGKTSFEVKNDTWGLDTVAPVLVAGKVLTPTVSLSDPYEWTGVQMEVTDSGSPVASGPRYILASFCTLDLSSCLELQGAESLAGLTKVSGRSGEQLSGGFFAPGVYYLQQVVVSDWASNFLNLVGTDFNGSTDFSVLFPAGHTITVTN